MSLPGQHLGHDSRKTQSLQRDSGHGIQKKMISDSQKITIPSTPTAAASTLQYFHLHRGFKACNDVNYVKKKKNIGYEYDSYLPN